MGELKHFKICTGWIKICHVSRLTWVFLSCGLFLESPENFSDSRFSRGIREICENPSVPRHFLTILVGFILRSIYEIIHICTAVVDESEE